MPIERIPDTATARTLISSLNSVIDVVNGMLVSNRMLVNNMAHEIHQLRRAAELLAQPTANHGTYAAEESSHPTEVTVTNNSTVAVNVTAAPAAPQLIAPGQRISVPRSNWLAIVFNAPDKPELRATYFGDPKDIVWRGFCLPVPDSILSAVMATLIPGNLVLSGPAATDGVATFVNKSLYTVEVKIATPSQSHIVHYLGTVAIPVGSCITISIPAMGLHHMYCGNSTLLEWNGFPEHLMAARNTTALIQATSTVTAVFTEGDKIDFNDGNINKEVRVFNDATDRKPVEVWNGSAFVRVAHGDTATVTSQQFANIVVRDPRTHATGFYQGVARKLTFKSFTPDYPSEVHFDNGFHFFAEENGNSLRLQNRLSPQGLDQVVFHRRDTQWPTLEVKGRMYCDSMSLHNDWKLYICTGALRISQGGSTLVAVHDSTNPSATLYSFGRVSASEYKTR
ncbi:hypothetical protein HDU77_005173 [Chytriomyces hyalinus]|nr:hypothetical protein HDU77_005173 [Chytriomyces hyalinus]